MNILAYIFWWAYALTPPEDVPGGESLSHTGTLALEGIAAPFSKPWLDSYFHPPRVSPGCFTSRQHLVLSVLSVSALSFNLMDIIIIKEHRATHQTLWENRASHSGSWTPSLLRECGESHLPATSQPQDPARGSPDVSLPEITHWAATMCGGRGGPSESAYFHISESSRSKGTTAKFPFSLKSLEHFVRSFQHTEREPFTHYVSHLILFLSSLNPKLTAFTRSNFYLSFWKGLSRLASSTRSRFETPVKSLSSIFIFQQYC